MWVTEFTTVNGPHSSGLNRIGRITTAGVETTSYDIPTSGAGASGGGSSAPPSGLGSLLHYLLGR